MANCPCPCCGPSGWFKFNTPGIPPIPACNPLSYTFVPGIPPFSPVGPKIQYIYACIQIINSVQRPVICSTLCTEIQTALATLVSSPNVIMGL